MAKVTFVVHGSAVEVDAEEGKSLMQAAVAADIEGIEAECGGGCSCATCHVVVDPAWIGIVGRAAGLEAGMLEFARGVTPESRLSCQIKVTAALEGLVVRVADGAG